ncbi:MAG: hypothetical protein ABSB41_06420 [Anaerolineales bacterium]|jgi:uncharacterized protein involved in exopolysaccharide biosynthesis
MNDRSPRLIFERALSTWWIIVVLMILGGIAGWVFGHLRTPLYEAAATYEVSLDQQQIAMRLSLPPSQLPLDALAQNTYLAPVEILFVSPDVRTRLVADATVRGIKLKYQDINQANFSIDRRGTLWFIRVRNTDSLVAVTLVNLWVAEADKALQEALAHSDQAQALQVQRTAVQKCFSELDFAQANPCAGTTFSTPAALQAYLNQLDQQINSEVLADQGIDPALTFHIGQQAEPPAEPVLYVTSEIILAGSLIGLLAGIVIGQLVPTARAQVQ